MQYNTIRGAKKSISSAAKGGWIVAWTQDVRPIRPLPGERWEGFGPHALFAGALLVAAAGWAATESHATDLAEPLAVTLLFVLAAAATLMARRRGAAAHDRVTYWDVAGALTLIGIGAATLIEPEQMLRLVEAGNVGNQDNRISSR
jgi:hypothetical protein